MRRRNQLISMTCVVALIAGPSHLGGPSWRSGSQPIGAAMDDGRAACGAKPISRPERYGLLADIEINVSAIQRHQIGAG
jgi:hypothetical protein